MTEIITIFYLFEIMKRVCNCCKKNFSNRAGEYCSIECAM